MLSRGVLEIKHFVVSVKNIKVHEEWEKENGKKVILAHMRKRQNSEIIKSLALLRENLSQVSQPHNQVTSSDATVRKT